MKFSVASFQNVLLGLLTSTADDGSWFPMFVEGVLDVIGVITHTTAQNPSSLTIVVNRLVLFAVKVGLAIKVCLKMIF